jgi:GntR family transcriptional regulator
MEMLRAIDPKSAVPIYRQVMDQISRAVAAGVLASGDQLPSVRELAAQLLLNPNTIARVYRDLEREGLVEMRRGEGTYISPDASALRESERRRLIAEELAAAARDVHSFGVPEEEAIRLFREALHKQNPGRKDSR